MVGDRASDNAKRSVTVPEKFLKISKINYCSGFKARRNHIVHVNVETIIKSQPSNSQQLNTTFSMSCWGHYLLFVWERYALKLLSTIL